MSGWAKTVFQISQRHIFPLTYRNYSSSLKLNSMWALERKFNAVKSFITSVGGGNISVHSASSSSSASSSRPQSGKQTNEHLKRCKADGWLSHKIVSQNPLSMLFPCASHFLMLTHPHSCTRPTHAPNINFEVAAAVEHVRGKEGGRAPDVML